MAYLVLARKYRPQTFDQLIGQNHITDILRKAIEQNRIAHAFLFCGPRGVGKTSTARIMAKSLNCEKGPTLQPCGQCSACKEIAAGNSFDVIEIDGASNRGIDEIRALRENVKFAPAYGRFKIYIVDEVHMLTSEAFNALLKTLEEPPEHVKFIFATTEANKVPATILSRCQRFDFKRIPLDLTIANLKSICQSENLKINEEALMGIAKAAQGSQRDALSILDQLSSLGDAGIESKDVYSMLGIVETEFLFAITDALLARDCSKALSILNEVIERGKDIKQLSKDMTEHFRHMMIVKIGGQSLSHLVDYPAAIKQRLHEQSQKVEIGWILKCIDILIQSQDTARVMEMMRMPLELAFAKMTLIGANPVMAANPAPVGGAPAPSKPQPVPVIKPAAKTAAAPVAASAGAVPPAPTQKTKLEGDLTLEQIKKDWNVITHDVSRKKMSAATYMQDGQPVVIENGKLIIGFTKDHSFAMESLGGKDNIALIEQILLARYGVTVPIGVRAYQDMPKAQAEPMVDDVVQMFGGQVVKQWPQE